MKRTSSSACRLAGSDVATNRRLPRLCSGRTRRVGAILGSKYSLLIWSRSKLVQVEQRDAERARGEHRELRRGHALADRTCSTKRDPGGLRLRLQRLGVVFRQQAVLGQRAGEAADVTGGGVCGHRQKSSFVVFLPRRLSANSRLGWAGKTSSERMGKQSLCRSRPFACVGPIPCEGLQGVPRSSGRLFHSHKTWLSG